MDEELKKKFDNLVKLQEVEIESASVQARLADFPRLLTDLDDRLKASEGAVTLEAGRLSEIQQAYRVQEADAKVIQARIVKSEEKLRSVKTNKEYQSSLKEIDDLKGSLSAVEDRMLAYLDEMDQVAVSVATKKDEVEALLPGNRRRKRTNPPERFVCAKAARLSERRPRQDYCRY